MKFCREHAFFIAAVLIAALVAYYVWANSKETFDPICSWKNPQSVLISLDVLPNSTEYVDTETAKKACAADAECTGVLSTTAGSTTTYKLTRTQPTVSNTNPSMQFIEKGMCKKGTEQPTTGLRGLSDMNTLVVPSMSAATNDAANAARLPDAPPPPMPLNTPLSRVTGIPLAGPPPMGPNPMPAPLNLPPSGVTVIPAVAAPPMPAVSTLGTTVGQSGMLGTNPPRPKM
uniref:Uncharacterized protein n=1 Tax=viral metagenome TaxID=1070528 RepID=A0A6C0HJX8_9ZZZZ